MKVVSAFAFDLSGPLFFFVSVAFSQAPPSAVSDRCMVFISRCRMLSVGRTAWRTTCRRLPPEQTRARQQKRNVGFAEASALSVRRAAATARFGCRAGCSIVFGRPVASVLLMSPSSERCRGRASVVSPLHIAHGPGKSYAALTRTRGACLIERSSYCVGIGARNIP